MGDDVRGAAGDDILQLQTVQSRDELLSGSARIEIVADVAMLDESLE